MTRMRRLRRRLRLVRVRLAMIRIALKALLSTRHPVLVQLIPIRRCNLACTYCNEYDDRSPPVPTAELLARIDHLASLGASIVSFSGGEPLLHPDLDQLIAHIKRRGMFAELLTNGYLLTVERIRRLNRAGLDRLQISIDNLRPDEVSKKSLKVLDRSLTRLAEHSLFEVNINSVVGGGAERASDAVAVARRARELGFTSTVGVIHDSGGQLKPLSAPEQAAYREVQAIGRSFGGLMKFKDNLVAGRPNDWRCRAGARYLYVCEDGLVHYCSQQRGMPGVPLLTYTRADLRREYLTSKSCAPYCTVSCVQTVAQLDSWRGRQVERALAPGALAQIGGLRRQADDR